MSDTRHEPTEVAEGLWSAEGSVRFLGQRVSTRATIVRLGSGELLVYSPVPLTSELRAAVDAIGPVGHLAAPSLYHHLSLGEWAAAYPEARTYGAPGLRVKRPELRIDEELGDVAPAGWKGELEQHVFRGIPMFNELAMFHVATRTLILCDLVFNLHDADNRMARLVFRLDGMWKRFGPSYATKLVLRRNREAARAGLAAIHRWDYERVIPAHGRILEAGGPAAMREAFAFLGEP